MSKHFGTGDSFASQCHFRRIPDFAWTDADGIFRFTRIPAGKYRVSLSHPDFFQDLENPDLLVGPESQPWVGILRRGITIEGEVVGPDGTGIPGVQVMLLRKDNRGDLMKGFSKVEVTDRKGTFRANGVMAGDYEAVFSRGDGSSLALVEKIDTTRLPSPPWKITLGQSQAKLKGTKNSLEK